MLTEKCFINVVSENFSSSFYEIRGHCVFRRPLSKGTCVRKMVKNACSMECKYLSQRSWHWMAENLNDNRDNIKNIQICYICRWIFLRIPYAAGARINPLSALIIIITIMYTKIPFMNSLNFHKYINLKKNHIVLIIKFMFCGSNISRF